MKILIGDSQSLHSLFYPLVIKNNIMNYNYGNDMLQIQVIWTTTEIDNKRCEHIFVETDTNDVANLLNKHSEDE